MRAIAWIGPLWITLVWGVLAGTYVLFTGSFGANEALAGAVSASLSALWWHRIAREGGPQFVVDLSSLTIFARSAAELPLRTIAIATRLARAIISDGDPGVIRTRALDARSWPDAARDGRAGTAARAFGTLAASLAPDSYVLRLDPARQEVLEHAFDRKSTREGA